MSSDREMLKGCLSGRLEAGNYDVNKTPAETGPLDFRRPIFSLLLLLVVFSPWGGLGRDQSSVRQPVWLWYAASWASS